MEDQPPPSETLGSPPSSVPADHLPSSSSDSSAGHLLCRSGSFSRLNARAPEFVPRPPPQGAPHAPCLVIPAPAAGAAPPPGLVQAFSPPNSPYHVPVQVPVQGPNNHHHHHGQYHAYHHSHHQHHHHGDNDSQRTPSDADHAAPSKNSMSEEAKIVNQVEYYFSDVNLATTDHLIRFINKDPEGYVPLSVVASFKKIKSFTNNHSQLAAILRNSKKLVVSEDGKKVKRQHPLTESDMEELQSRIVIAENLPEDHCYQNLMKIFSAFGSVKSIRTCQPQPSNSGASASRSAKADNLLFSNKLHAFVEYETVELAEKAVSGLNDEGSWRSSLRLRLLKRMPNQVRGRKGHEGDVNCDEGDASTSEQHPNELSEDPSRQSEAHPHEHAGEENLYDREGGHRKGCNRGRAKGRGRAHYHHINNNNHNHGSSAGTALLNGGLPNNDHHLSVANKPPGPRMPDGTRGFGMGRGKPVAVHTE